MARYFRMVLGVALKVACLCVVSHVEPLLSSLAMAVGVLWLFRQFMKGGTNP